MGKYYCLIAGLPNIALDDSKLTYSISEFRQELDGILTKADKKLIDLFFLKFDNKNLIDHLKQPDRDSDQRGCITYEEFDALYKALKEEEKIPKNDRIPPYFKAFFFLFATPSTARAPPLIDRAVNHKTRLLLSPVFGLFVPLPVFVPTIPY